MQAYSDPKCASMPHALPDVEIFEVEAESDQAARMEEEGSYRGQGWYWWSCFPNCDATGPFATEDEALADAQEGCDDDV
jgi:hypothetical protein